MARFQIDQKSHKAKRKTPRLAAFPSQISRVFLRPVSQSRSHSRSRSQKRRVPQNDLETHSQKEPIDLPIKLPALPKGSVRLVGFRIHTKYPANVFSKRCKLTSIIKRLPLDMIYRFIHSHCSLYSDLHVCFVRCGECSIWNDLSAYGLVNGNQGRTVGVLAIIKKKKTISSLKKKNNLFLLKSLSNRKQ